MCLSGLLHESIKLLCFSLSPNTHIFSLHLACVNAFVKRKLFLASKKCKYNTILFRKISKFVMYEESLSIGYTGILPIPIPKKLWILVDVDFDAD